MNLKYQEVDKEAIIKRHIMYAEPVATIDVRTVGVQISIVLSYGGEGGMQMFYICLAR